MREILFRGKRPYDGEWVEGNLFIPDKEDTPTQICIGTNIVRITYDIIPETVGQYTGLTDKNGKKIFEGDIVHCLSNTDCGNCVVIFEEGEFRLVPNRYYKTYTTGGGYHAIRCFIKEVIGNIHDNPELMKGGE